MKLPKANSKKIFQDTAAILGLTQQWKSEKRSIVFTNGCFDILHAGHVDYLEKASSMGDILIIGLNTDKSVRKIKGENRPINKEDNRAYLLASLNMVDAVVLFDEETPEKLISAIIPSVLLKGGDYKVENIIGADTVLKNGGRVETIDFIHPTSTSNIIQKIQTL